MNRVRTGANKAGACPRFAAGLCPNNKQEGRLVHGRPQPRGRARGSTPPMASARAPFRASSPHTLRFRACAATAKNCAYLHNKYAAHAPRAIPPTAVCTLYTRRRDVANKII
eukprot:scaffold25496_cov130-Isochrysis_galbana.AAC.2